MPNVLMASDRSNIIKEINSYENKNRKNESLKKIDVYQKRQRKYVQEQLIGEYSRETVKDMRVITSINLCNRIVNQKSSLYDKDVTRIFSTLSGDELSDDQLKQLDQLYKTGDLDNALKKANRMFSLAGQCALQILPKNGAITARVLLPHHYDVIPREDDPELPYAYVLSVYDKSILYNQLPRIDSNTNYLSTSFTDQINQTIADSEDYKAKQNRYIWWTADYNFITDGYGNIISPDGMPMVIKTEADMASIANPLSKLPFVDIAMDKEYEYWVRQGSDVVDFSIDFSVLLSDTAETNKRQSYSQAIVYSEEPPKDMLIGPHIIMHMKQDKNSEVQPRFEWSTPSPDMQASLELLEIYLRLFLSAEGQDPTSISGKAEAKRYSSGVDRLLALIEKFEASADDMSVFSKVEREALEIMSLWSNIMQGATIRDGGVEPLVSALQNATLPDDLMVKVQYAKPEGLKSQQESEEIVFKRIENRLMSRKQAVMELYGLSEDDALRKIQDIDLDDGLGSEQVM